MNREIEGKREIEDVVKMEGGGEERGGDQFDHEIGCKSRMVCARSTEEDSIEEKEC